MSTQRQIESARINGAKSRGPKTLEGKRRSSGNARKHGLTSKTMAADPESVAIFNEEVAAYTADLHPGSPEELALVRQMAAASLLLQQAGAAETAAWNRALAHDGCIATAFHRLSESNELACILRYETRFKRQYDRALEQFLAARAARLRNEPESAPSAPPRETILPNEPEPNATNPPPQDDFAKRTGFIPTRRHHPCSHPAWFCQTNRNRRTLNRQPLDTARHFPHNWAV